MGVDPVIATAIDEHTRLRFLIRDLIATFVSQAQSVWGFRSRAVTLGVRALAFDASGRVFLVRHTYREGFYLPGGGVERNETAQEAILREIKEEGDLIATQPPGLFGLYRNGSVLRDHVALFVLRDVIQTAPKQPDWEIREAGFFSLDALPESTTPATRARLAEYTNGAQTNLDWRV